MGINEACEATEKFLAAYDSGVGVPVAVQVRPSGDEVDAIKVRVDLGPAASSIDPDEWERTCAEALRKALPALASYRFHIRVEADRPSTP